VEAARGAYAGQFPHEFPEDTGVGPPLAPVPSLHSHGNERTMENLKRERDHGGRVIEIEKPFGKGAIRGSVFG